MKENNIGEFIEINKLTKGTRLYRHVDVAPNKCRLEISQNKGKTGRCNFYQNIYYCATSIEAIKIERNQELRGSLILSEVIEPIYIGKVINEDVHMLLRGRIEDEDPQLVHKEILQQIKKDVVTTYAITNFITKCILKITPDGIRYSSVNSIDTVIGSILFQLTEETGWSNIALTEKGYNKIKEYKVVDISNYQN